MSIPSLIRVLGPNQAAVQLKPDEMQGLSQKKEIESLVWAITD
jgi:hypothetical protein